MNRQVLLDEYEIMGLIFLVKEDIKQLRSTAETLETVGHGSEGSRWRIAEQERLLRKLEDALNGEGDMNG